MYHGRLRRAGIAFGSAEAKRTRRSGSGAVDEEAPPLTPLDDAMSAVGWQQYCEGVHGDDGRLVERDHNLLCGER